MASIVTRVAADSKLTAILALFCSLLFVSSGPTASAQALTSPTPGTKLSGSSATFSWSPAAGATKFILYLGTTGVNSRNVFSSGTIATTSVAVAGLPQNGMTVYARLYSMTGSTWQYTDSTYMESGTSAPPSIKSPAAGSKLSGSGTTFSWTAGSGTSPYILYLGSTGVNSRNIYTSTSTTATSEAVSGLPQNGSTIYVRLYWLAGNTWMYADSSYTSSVPALAAVSCAQSSMSGAGTDACTVTLAAAAPSGGSIVSLASNNSSVAVPASVAVAAGATSAGFSTTVSTFSSSQMVTLTGTVNSLSKNFGLALSVANPTLAINASSVAFGDVTANSPATQSLTLTSTGAAAVIINSARTTGTGFSVSGASFPITLNPGQAVELSVEFDPTTAGAAAGQLTISSNSSTNGTAVISLSGMGQSAAGGTGTNAVNVTWDAPGTSGSSITGYNIYRALKGSTFYQLLNSSVDTQTTYADATAQSGQSYDYVVQTIDTNGTTSSPSLMASVLIS